MYRDEDDLRLLAELAGVLDQTVTAAGLSSGTYLVLRELAEAPAEVPVTELAERLRAEPDEIAELCGRLKQAGLAAPRPAGVAATDEGRATAGRLEGEANEAMRAYVLERPHTATVYGLVAAMQTGRFTVTDLLEMIAEGPTTEDDEG
jgi:DNA-binding MarR family transcriptional regulator